MLRVGIYFTATYICMLAYMPNKKKYIRASNV